MNLDKMIMQIQGYINEYWSMKNELENLKNAVDDYENMPNCNTCFYKYNCKYTPLPGQVTRINCFRYKK